jgi:hypothetical protein
MQTEEEEEEPEDDSSLLAGGPGTGEDDNSLTSASDDEQLMSDAEQAQRKIMLELVYAAAKARASPPVNPVDAKVENLIRESMRRAALGAPLVETSADDMTLDTCYNSTMSTMSDLSLPGVRPRSNSLPTESSQSDKGFMDTS